MSLSTKLVAFSKVIFFGKPELEAFGVVGGLAFGGGLAHADGAPTSLIDLKYRSSPCSLTKGT